MNLENPYLIAPEEKLTPREIEVLTLTAWGRTREGISCCLSISETTVKTHLDNICRKLNAHNKTHATAMAIAMGLIMPYPSAKLPRRRPEKK